MTAAPTPAHFDELIHSPVRLRICALLRRMESVEFGVVRDTLGLADAQLSKNLRTLSDAGYVRLDKAADARRTDDRRLTWLALTPLGRTALEGHLAALAELAAEA